MRQLYAEPGWTPPGHKSARRETVESGGQPWIKLVIGDDDTVSISALGVPEQNVIPVLARIVKAYAAQGLPE